MAGSSQHQSTAAAGWWEQEAAGEHRTDCPAGEGAPRPHEGAAAPVLAPWDSNEGAENALWHQGGRKHPECCRTHPENFTLANEGINAQPFTFFDHLLTVFLYKRYKL